MSKTEPVIVNQAVTLLISVLVSAGLVTWGPEAAAENSAAITAGIIALAEIVQAIITRGQVYSPATVEEMAASGQIDGEV